MNLKILSDKYSIYKFKSESALPAWIYSSEFYSITKTRDEVSVVAIQTDLASEEIICYSNDWRIIKIEGPLDFSIVGIIADFSAILKKKNISILTTVFFFCFKRVNEKKTIYNIFFYTIKKRCLHR